VLGTRKINAMPLPVSIALAGQTNARFSRKVIATCKTKQVSIAERICGTLTWKPSPTWPRVCNVMTTMATWRRESRIFGKTTG